MKSLRRGESPKVSKRKAYIDFEFSGVLEPKLKLVSCAILDAETKETRKFWLFKDPAAQKELVKYLKQFQVFIAWSAPAEQRSFIALGLDPLDFEWEDWFIEYRLISNHNTNIQYGKQLVDGKVRMTKKPKPKFERTEEDEQTGFRQTHSLAEATFKLTGKIRDTQHKDDTRNLIISYPDKFKPKQREQILDYNLEDVVFMPQIRAAIIKEFFRLLPKYDRKKYLAEIRGRGRYAAHTAWMENNGYPINVEATRNFSKQIPSILMDVQREINLHHASIKPFRWNKKEGRFSWNQKETKLWIKENHDVSRWTKTDGGDLSLSLEAFEKFYPFKHDYPLENLGAQFVRFLKLRQSLYGFAENKDSDRKTFWDYVGPDGRVRPYMNTFGAQSSRSQPAASGFMFLKPAWMRALVQPNDDEFIAGIDYGSQEFFIAALLAGDENMIQAYLSGDVYLAFGKLSGQIPQNGTKKTHSAQRDLCKATVLGISYLMTKYGLAIKLSSDTGTEWTEEEAQEQIDLFYSAFDKLGDWQQETMEDYEAGHPIVLPDGWVMFKDNDNIRSVVNVPIQGRGAVIMRKAVDIYHKLTGDHTLFTLHDALYIKGKVGDEWKIVALHDAMAQAFASIFPAKYRDKAMKIRLDPKAWSKAYKGKKEIEVKALSGFKLKVPVSEIHIDGRAQADYDKFSQYFDSPITDLL